MKIKKKRLNFSLMKKIIILFFVLHSCFSYSQCLKTLMEDLSKNSKEFKAIVNENIGFEAWQLLADNAPTLRTDINELNLVSKNLDEVNKVGYTAWKKVSKAGNVVPSSLITKLTESGATKLKAWTSGKSLNFVDDVGNVLTGANAEAKIFEKLDGAIGNQNVLGIFEDAQGRLLIQCEGVNRNTVYGVLTNKNGRQVVYKFEPAYKPSANASIPVPLSANKLAPDFANTQYLYPVNGNQKSIVKIKMSGTRNSTSALQGDFELANIKAGFNGKIAPKFIDINGNEISYTWHRLDDFNLVTGERTMQLVRSDAHTGVQGMTHSGSVSQYKVYNGSGY